MERLDSYQSITVSEDDKKMQKALKTAEMDKFWAMLFIKGSDQSRFGVLMTELCQSYANSRDLYPTKLSNIVDVRRIIPQNKKERGEGSKNDKSKTTTDETSPAEETGLAQREKD